MNDTFLLFGAKYEFWYIENGPFTRMLAVASVFMEKTCLGRANFSYISLQNLTNSLHEKQKVVSVRRMTHLAGAPS